ncbi:hypothetical protein DFQ04_0604 [Algoriphagus boseongensis]|uniref:TonB-dependent receptor n=1 Tax=Algoriphagus boseongensis TaxID=1442587 RepID=A0A4R6T7Y6_9BACT|nr:TonB-dependent receptor [Algoriphagus boseongensis]TDQ18796.1 hypothetical protein DFQ04_0604 [Algoriphagus boseongensis]
MKRLFLPLIFIGVGLLSKTDLMAQTEKRGEVQDQEFVIRKDRVLTVPAQPRVFERLPVLPQPSGIQDFRYSVTPYFLKIPALTLQPTAVQKDYRQPKLDLYSGYVRAGYGNFDSPLLEARFMSISPDPVSYSVNFKHQGFRKGPAGTYQDISPESHTLFSGDLGYFLSAAEIYGGLNWAQDKYSFYGEDPNFQIPNEADWNDPIVQSNILNNFQIFGGIRDIEKVGPFSYDAQLRFRTFKDSYLAKENEFGVRGEGKFRTDSDWSGKVGVEYFSTSPSNESYEITRSYFGIRPRISYDYEAFRFTAGINVVSEDDSIPGKESDFRIFPVLKASYQFAEEFGFFAEFSGDVNLNTYFGFVQENPFLGPDTRLLNTVNNYKVDGGIEGQFQETFHYRAGIDLSRYNNLHFFVNSMADSARFDIVYDEKTTVVNVNAELGFKFSETYSLGSRLDLFQYSLSTEAEAWHRPVWEFRVNNQIKPFEKLLIQANLNFMGGLKARGINTVEINPPVQEVVNLKTIADIQLKADFKITDRISVFAEGNNLTNGQNMRWLNYPVRGVQLIGGASFKF